MNQRQRTLLNAPPSFALAILVMVVLAPASLAVDLTFTNIAEDPAAGLAWERVPSPRLALRQAVVDMSPIPNAEFGAIRANLSPQKPRGNPGLVIFDFDRDGDLDIYATNGPGENNSLFVNQLRETGLLTFVDQGGPAGVGAFNQDSAGACAGDIDNDGDQDLYVLGTGETNLLFENQGNGSFLEITASAGVGGDGRHPSGCSFGDIDNDGLLDVVVANTYDSWDHRIPVFTRGPTYSGMEHNYLFHNLGGNTFEDVSATSGIQNVSNMPGGAFTWAIAMADYDQDGDIDILSADNQGSAPTEPSEERGYNRIFQNDGGGNFTDVTVAAGLDFVGGWMGVDFGDLNCDGHLDFFSSNLGYLGFGQPAQWFFGNADGTFTNPGPGPIGMTPFGWGISIFDYDNDADADIVYHGGVDILSLIIKDNPGVLLRNIGDCTGEFEWDSGAFSTNHQDRMVHAVAVGDLNNDGFEDIVSASNFNVVEKFAVPFSGVFTPPFGSPFDAVATFEVAFFSRVNPGFQTYIDPEIVRGDMAVEISSADNGNHWAAVNLRGSVGTLPNGRVNRDGVGAVVSFTPKNGKTSKRPIIAGSSYSSQDSLTANFGLGLEGRGTVDVLWPGGVKNRRHNVRQGKTVLMPEIPCSIDTTASFHSYKACVFGSLLRLRIRRVISGRDFGQLFISAILGYLEEH